MRRIDDLPKGTYELELVREELGPRPGSPLGSGDAFGGAPRRRVLRVLSTSEEVEDARWESEASPAARFIAEVRGVGAVQLRRR